MKTKRNSRAVYPSSSVLNAPRPHALGHGRRRDIRYGGKRRLLRPGVKSLTYPGLLPKASSKAEPEPYNARTSSARASPGRKRNAPAYQGARPFPYPVPPLQEQRRHLQRCGLKNGFPRQGTPFGIVHNSPPLSGILPAVSAFPCGNRPARRTPPAPDGRAHRPLQLPAADGIRQRHGSTPTP